MTDPHNENMRRQISDDTKKKQIYISLLLMAKSFQLYLNEVFYCFSLYLIQVYAKGAAFEVEIPIVRTTWEKIRITNQVQTTKVCITQIRKFGWKKNINSRNLPYESSIKILN
jgi:hypothetical protein